MFKISLIFIFYFCSIYMSLHSLKIRSLEYYFIIYFMVLSGIYFPSLNMQAKQQLDVSKHCFQEEG